MSCGKQSLVVKKKLRMRSGKGKFKPKVKGYSGKHTQSSEWKSEEEDDPDIFRKKKLKFEEENERNLQQDPVDDDGIKWKKCDHYILRKRLEDVGNRHIHNCLTVDVLDDYEESCMVVMLYNDKVDDEDA
ncbi:hypothetical protein E3N88_40280 [Mikania micrantha]|uniref:Uncharacterized protein n=1 Tax=Mikania micrantha TaxID=192012 RepID=A0A5N6LM64_9ASTR|nr:hypothetical protein E3N88_40280 [Mikania micrantha]